MHTSATDSRFTICASAHRSAMVRHIWRLHLQVLPLRMIDTLTLKYSEWTHHLSWNLTYELRYMYTYICLDGNNIDPSSWKVAFPSYCHYEGSIPWRWNYLNRQLIWPCSWHMNCDNTQFAGVNQRFSTFTVLRSLDDISKVAVTPNNRTDWVTSKESLFRELQYPSPYFC